MKQAPQATLKRFHETILQDDVAARMRRVPREPRTPKAFKSVAQDRPRPDFQSLRREIDDVKPDAVHSVSVESELGRELYVCRADGSLGLMCATSGHWAAASKRTLPASSLKNVWRVGGTVAIPINRASD
ncbi:hypothetical protein [Bosea lathyri]|uniref:Uncharacterized protein n=1 Tax=Bosea lathyri TaxID=1036778 RepID=A0A1H6BSN4_9HYPH|nr:hypothetical protein [Bosea lathyri]SEG63708.1 hypothetical protein SAMN04488115_10826 [Bosea lathyri]